MNLSGIIPLSKRMEEILTQLSHLEKEQNIQNIDQFIGKATYLLHIELTKSNEEFSSNIEDILLSLISYNEKQLSPVTANGIGICLLEYYKRQKKQDLWNFINLMTEEIKKYNLVAIIVLGVVSRHMGSLFKAKLFAHISTLSNSPNPNHFPYICQCYRRIILGTGNFLEKSIPTIFTFIKRCISATAENLRNEAVKTLPVLCSHANIDYQKLLPLIHPVLVTESSSNRYFIAKSLAKLLFYGCNGDISVLTKNYILLLQQNEKSSQTVCSSLFISLRFFEPISLVVKLKTFSKFLFNISTINMSVQTMIYVVGCAIKAYFSVIGSTVGKSICAQLIDYIQSEKLTFTNALVLLVCMQNTPDLPIQQLQQSLRLIYALLDCESSDIRTLSINYFSTLSTKDVKLSNLFFESFLVLIQDEQTLKTNAYISYCTVISLLMNHSATSPLVISSKNCSKVQQICTQLCDSVKSVEELRFSGLLILSIGLLQVGLLNTKIIDTIVTFIQKLKFKAQDIQNKTKTGQSLCKAIKYIGAFLVAVMTKKNSQFAKQLIQLIPKFVIDILPVSSYLSSASIFCLCTLAQYVQINESLAFVFSKSLIQMIGRKFNSSDFDFDAVITPFNDDIETLNLLYYTAQTTNNNVTLNSGLRKHVINVNTIFTVFCGLNSSSHRTGCCKLVIELFPTFLRHCDEKVRRDIANSLFDGSGDVLCGQLMLMKSLLHRRSTFSILPENTLPKLLCIKASSNMAMKRVIASLVGRWLHYYPMLLPAIFEHLEHPKKSQDFSSLLVAECSPIFTQGEYRERAVKLVCNRAVGQTTSDSLFALLQFIKTQSADQLSEPAEALEQILYSNSIKTVSELFYFLQCVNAIGDFQGQFRTAIAAALLNYNTMIYTSQLLTINLLIKNRQKSDINTSYVIGKVQKVRSLEAPPFLFITTFNIQTYLDDVPMMFTLLQQTGSKRVAESLVKTFVENPVVPLWTDLCKRIILNNCVPPSERIGDNKVTPTRLVLISAMQISVLLVRKIRENFPENLNCIDIIIANAFNAIQMKDSKIDNNAFNIVSSVISNFSDIRNGSEPFLTLFNAQLNPMFNHACEETRKFQNVAEYCLEYLSFQKKKEEIQDSVQLIAKRIEKLKITKSTSLVFARVSSKIRELSPADFDKLEQNFIVSFGDVLSSLCRQEYKLSALKKEVICFVRCVLAEKSDKISEEQKRILLLLIFQQIDTIGIEKLLLCADEFAKENILNEKDYQYVLSHCAAIEPVQVQEQVFTVKPEKKFSETAFKSDTSSDGEIDDEEENTFYVVNENQQIQTILTNFLITAASKCKGEIFSNTRKTLLSISLSQKPICFPCIGYLLQNASSEELRTILPPVFVASSIQTESEDENKKGEAVRYLILTRLKDNDIAVIDALVQQLSSQYNIEQVSQSLIQIFTHFPTFAFGALKGDLPHKISSSLLPHGLAFLCSLMSNDSTKETAVYLMKNGAIDTLDDVISLKDVPRVLHFLRLLLNTVKYLREKVTNEEGMKLSICTTCLVCVSLTDGVKERKSVLSIAAQLFQDVGSKEICEKAFTSLDRETQTHVIKAFTPPKKLITSSIQLVSFSTSANSRRSTQSQGWQTLTVEED